MLGRSNPYTGQKRQTRRQVRGLGGNVLKTLKLLDSAYPDTDQAQDLLTRHKHREQAIVHPRRKRPKYVLACDICGRPTNQSAELWTDSLGLKLLFSLAVCGLFCLIGWFFGWIALVVPVVAWIISFSFLYAITIPTLMFIVVLLILIPFRG